MPLSRIQRVSKLIDRINNELVPTGRSIYWSGPVPEKRIRKAEGVIGYSFPASFRALLSQAGGGGIESFSILGVPEDLFLNQGSVIRMSDYWRDERGLVELPEHLLVIQHSEDGDEPFCLDLSSFSGDECPVVLYYPYDGRVDSVAPTFIDFWEAFTESYFEEEVAKPKPSKKASKPKVTAKASKPKVTTKASKPKVTTKASKPKVTVKASKPKASKKASKSKVSTKASKPKASKKASKSKVSTKAAKSKKKK